MQETEPMKRSVSQEGGPLVESVEPRLPESGATEGPINVYDRPERSLSTPGVIVLVLLVVIALVVAFYALPNLF